MIAILQLLIAILLVISAAVVGRNVLIKRQARLGPVAALLNQLDQLPITGVRHFLSESAEITELSFLDGQIRIRVGVNYDVNWRPDIEVNGVLVPRVTKAEENLLAAYSRHRLLQHADNQTLDFVLTGEFKRIPGIPGPKQALLEATTSTGPK